MPKFIVHRHDTPLESARKPHWDLMLQKCDPENFDAEDRTLETWALESPLEIGGPIKATKLEDHRAHYLDNDGPLSNNRGVIATQMSGEFDWVTNSAGLKICSIRTNDGNCHVALTQLDGDEFEVEVFQDRS